MNRVVLKSRAKEALGNGIFQTPWLLAVVVCAIVGLIEGLAAGVTFGIASLLVTGPLMYGTSYVFLKNARERNQQIAIEDVFKCFKDDLGGIVLLGLMICIFTFLWSLLLVIPGIVKAYGYSQAFNIKIDHPEYDWRTCIKESEKMMAGHKAELFVLDLSFIGWAILGSFCFGIGTLWVMAYMYATKAEYYQSLIGASVNAPYAPPVDSYQNPSGMY